MCANRWARATPQLFMRLWHSDRQAFFTAILSVQNGTAFDKKVVNGIEIKKMLDICFEVWYSSQQEKKNFDKDRI